MAGRTLTLRLTMRPADADGLAAAAAALRAGGIEVLSQGPTALTLAGTAEALARFFGATVEADAQGARFSSEPTYNRLPAKYSYSAYFPTKPTYF